MLQQMKRIILLGVIGNGKTTLYNKITNSKNKTKYGGESVTLQIYLKSSAYGKGFQIMDTPGYGVEKNKLEHASGILAALSEGDVSRICIVVKFERIEMMQQNLKKILQPLWRNKDIITVIVTYWDLSSSQDEDQEQILTCFQRLNINSVLFSSLQDKGQSICKQLDDILEKSSPRKAFLYEKEIFIHFDLMTLTSDANLQLLNDENLLILKFMKIGTIYKQYINNLDEKKTKNVAEVMHALILSIKKRADDVIAQFIKAKGNRILDQVDVNGNNVSYLYYIWLKKKIFLDVKSVTELAQEKMYKNDDHCYKYIKKCPHCGLIWMKINGCDGVTKCGVGGCSNKIDEVIQKGSKPNTITVELQNDILIVKDLNEEVSDFKWFGWFRSKTDRPTQNATTHYYLGQNNLQNLDYKGCNKEFNWGQQPVLSENNLRELMSLEIMNYFSESEEEERKKDELYYTNEFYKELVKEAISEQIKKIIRQD